MHRRNEIRCQNFVSIENFNECYNFYMQKRNVYFSVINGPWYYKLMKPFHHKYSLSSKFDGLQLLINITFFLCVCVCVFSEATLISEKLEFLFPAFFLIISSYFIFNYFQPFFNLSFPKSVNKLTAMENRIFNKLKILNYSTLLF